MTSEQNQCQKSPERCSKCKKKSLILVGCQCGKNTCLDCRYPEKHDCQYNFKEQGAKTIEKNNPVVAGEKISKI